MCSGAIIKSELGRAFHGAPHKRGSNPDIYLRETAARSDLAIEIIGDIRQHEFMEQIVRGRQRQDKAVLFNS